MTRQADNGVAWMKYFDEQKMGRDSGRTGKGDSGMAWGLEQGDDGMPLLPTRQEHDRISRNRRDRDLEALRTGTERPVETEQESIFQDGRQDHEEASMGAENARQPADNFALPEEELPSY